MWLTESFTGHHVIGGVQRSNKASKIFVYFSFPNMKEVKGMTNEKLESKVQNLEKRLTQLEGYFSALCYKIRFDQTGNPEFLEKSKMETELTDWLVKNFL